MYVLEHFDEIMKDYEDRMDLAGAYRTPEQRHFLGHMKRFQKMIQEMRTKETISLEDKKRLQLTMELFLIYIINSWTREEMLISVT